jgi:cell division transport system permease protein
MAQTLTAQTILPLPASLKRNEPLVPVDSIASRALVTVIAILTFLAALSAGAAQIMASASSDWRVAIAREMTLQVRPMLNRDLETDVVAAARLAEQHPHIVEAKVYSKRESEELLAPWLGRGVTFEDLPVPRMIVLRLQPYTTAESLDSLRIALKEQLPSAILDDHKLFLSRLSAMANTVILLGLGIVVLVLTTTALAVAFATRGAMAGNRHVVEVLHFVGANDPFIARAFQGHFWRMGLKGSVLGVVSAFVLIWVLGFLANSWRTSAGGAQLEALFGAFELGFAGFAALLAVAGIVSAVTAFVSRWTVQAYLADVS